MNPPFTHDVLAPGRALCLITRTLFNPLPQLGLHAAGRISALALLAVAVLFSSLAAFDPALHGWLHCDAAPHHDGAPAEEHPCAVTLFAAGVVESVDVPRFDAAFSPQCVATIPHLPLIALPAVKYRLLPERAPPTVLV